MRNEDVKKLAEHGNTILQYIRLKNSEQDWISFIISNRIQSSRLLPTPEVINNGTN